MAYGNLDYLFFNIRGIHQLSYIPYFSATSSLYFFFTSYFHETGVLFGVILFSCIVTRASTFLFRAVNCLACVDCLQRGVGSTRLQPCSEVAVRLTSLMLFHSPYVPARGLVVSASVSVLVGREFDRLLPRPCKLVLQPSYQTHGVRKSCRELTQNDNKKNK